MTRVNAEDVPEMVSTVMYNQDDHHRRIRATENWIFTHEKKSTNHSIYFGLVLIYVVFDVFCRFL